MALYVDWTKVELASTKWLHLLKVYEDFWLVRSSIKNDGPHAGLWISYPQTETNRTYGCKRHVLLQKLYSYSPTKSDPFAASQIWSWSLTYWMLRERESGWDREIYFAGLIASGCCIVCMYIHGHVIRVASRNESEISFKVVSTSLEDPLKQDPSTDQATSPHLLDLLDGTTGNMCCPQPSARASSPSLNVSRNAHGTPISRDL